MMKDLFDMNEPKEIAKSFTINNSTRNAYVKKMYDISFDEVVDTFPIDFSIDFNWNVGLIVGQSGTGKTTIAKEKFKNFHLFDNHHWDYTKSVVDNFHQDLESKKMDGVSSCFFSKNKSQRNSASVISFSDKHKNSPKS